MRFDLEKILAHANDRFSQASPAAGRANQVESFKSFLRIEGERLRMRHRFGLSGAEVAGQRSLLVDLVVRHAAEITAAAQTLPALELGGCAVIALGGYGGRALAP